MVGSKTHIVRHCASSASYVLVATKQPRVIQAEISGSKTAISGKVIASHFKS
jgi:hypothetical protein